MQPNESYNQWLSFKKGEEQGFTFFFKALYPAFCQFANHLVKDKAESESLVTEAFLAVWNHRHKLSNPTDLQRYCYTAIRNNCLQWIKQQNKHNALQQELSALADASDAHVLDAMIRTELINNLYQSMQELPPQCAKIVSKLYVDGQSIKEIAEELNLSVSTVKTQKKIGLNYLKKTISSLILLLSNFL